MLNLLFKYNNKFKNNTDLNTYLIDNNLRYSTDSTDSINSTNLNKIYKNTFLKNYYIKLLKKSTK